MSLAVDITSKRFGDRPVLGPLAFTLGMGEILAIVGPSGCGKTTLLRIVGGLDRDYDGSVSWNAAATWRIGWVFQTPRLLPWRTVRQNVELVRPPGVDPTMGDRLIERLGLGPWRDSFAAELSLGMARRLALIRAVAIEPDLLLLDEPFVSLDAAMAAEARQVLLDAWRDRPVSALLVTHDLVEAASLADRILWLSRDPARIAGSTAVPAEMRRAGGAAAAAFADTLRRELTASAAGGDRSS